MRRRKLLIGLMSAGVFSAGFGAAVFPATAQLKTITVTLTGGKTVTVQVDQPADDAPQTVTLDAPGASTTARPAVSSRQATLPAQPTTDTTSTSPAPATTDTTSTSTTSTSTTSTSTTSTSTSTTPSTTTPTDTSTSPTPTDTTTTGTTPPETRTSTAPADPAATAPADTTTATSPEATPVPEATPAPTDPAPTDPASTTTEPATVPTTTTPELGAPTASAGGQQAQTTEGSTVRPDAEGVTPVKVAPVPLRRADGAPTTANPTFSEAIPGAAPIGVPNFIIDKFRIPPFLLPIYQAAGIEYGVRWEVLAGINEIETDYGRNLNVSSAGALGWMQFMPSTWAQYGVDANHDGKKDPYNPVDAIFAAARYLKAAGADTDVRQAVYAYNHADWYVDSVLMRARLIGGMPSDLVGSLTGLTQGRFPVDAKATYADDLTEKDLNHKVAKGHSAALADEAVAGRHGIDIFTKAGAPVIATQDARVTHLGKTKRLGRFVQIEDVYGNSYTYAHLGSVAPAYAVPKQQTVSGAEVRKELDLPKKDPKPTQAASAGTQQTTNPQEIPAAAAAKVDPRIAADNQTTPTATDVSVEKERAFANPSRPGAYAHGGEEQLLNGTVDIGSAQYRASLVKVLGIDAKDVDIKKLKVGSKVVAGTVLGHIGGTSKSGVASHLHFEIRPAGKGSPRVDPKPILDGWKLLESSAVYRAAGKNPFFGPDAKNPSIGQILLMSKESLQRTVLMDKRIAVYDCGRTDIRAGAIDRRVLATLEFLAASGLKPTVSALECGHSLMTTSGNVSEHSTGSAVDIAAINGIPIVGHQGPGSITDMTIRRLLTLQGTMKPHQIISLMSFEGTDNTLSMPDHYDHIHVGFRPLYGSDSKLGRQLNATLKPSQWIKLITRLGQIDNPKVLTSPSQYATDVKQTTTGVRASDAHQGE